MRHRPLHRVFSSLLAIWFAILIGAPGLVHACPAHDPSLRTHQNAAEHAHGMHQMDAAHRHTGDQDAPGHDSGCKHCTCIGSCAVPVAVSGPSDTVSLLIADAVSVASQLPATASVAPRRAADVGLPHANAPPRSL